MVTYRKALPKDFPHILDFINMVFSMSYHPHDFRQLLPKIYEKGQEEKSIHYLALDNEEIKTCVCVVPITLCCGNKTITCATVGSVSVHPTSKRKRLYAQADAHGYPRYEGQQYLDEHTFRSQKPLSILWI